MDDLILAKQALKKSDLAVCVYKDGNMIYSSKKIGISPLFDAYKQSLDFTDCSAADKVIGLGAACFWKALGIKSLATHILSAPALNYLKENDIDISYDILTDRILNRTNDGFCPVETLAKSESTFDEFLIKTEAFLNEKGLI